MPVTRSSTKSGREKSKADDRMEDLVEHSSALVPEPCEEVLFGYKTPGNEGPSVPANRDLEESDLEGKYPLAKTRAEAPAIIDRAISQELEDIDILESRQPMIDQAAQNLREMIAQLHPEGFCSDDLGDAYDPVKQRISFAATNFLCSVKWAQLTPAEQARVMAFAPKAEQLMESRRGTVALFQAWLWRILDEKIFSADPSTKWQALQDTHACWHQVGQLMTTFESFDTRPRAGWAVGFRLWKALSAEMARVVSDTPGPVPDDYAAKLILDDVGHLMTVDDEVKSVLGYLASDAAKLDNLLMYSRVKIRLRFDDEQQPLGFPFRGSLDKERGETGRCPPMTLHEVAHRKYWEAKPEVDGKAVELVTNPGFAFYGLGISSVYNLGSSKYLLWVRPIHAVVGEIPGPEGNGEDPNVSGM